MEKPAGALATGAATTGATAVSATATASSQQQQQATHVLFEFGPLDGREEIDDKTQRAYQTFKQLTAGKTTKESHEAYLKHLAVNAPHSMEELTMGLLVALLAEPESQQAKHYRDAVSISKDNLAMFSGYLNIIIIERLSKLREHSVKQIFWTTQQLIKANIAVAENVCSNLIRQAAGGDNSARNLWLVENLLDLLVENRHWLLNSTSFMIPTIIYTFMRLISDHLGPAQAALRQKEVEFVIGLIRERFLDCLQVGRDFLRLLHNINKIPEFEKLWHDIYNNPKSLHPTFLNPLQLLANRTPRRLFQSRLTFEIERKISFLATQVKFGNQKRYQDWFHKQYLSSPESLSLRCDLIRYICTIIHPSNEVLCSDIIPRWAIIGWLLTTCTSNTSASSSKLALFFDWLLYDTKSDNIMNIEPAILVMYYSLRSHPNVTASLLDYLCRLPSNFSPKLQDHIKAGIKKSLQQILEKRVIQSLAPLFDNPKHDSSLKSLIRETFPEFCASTFHVDNGISTAPLPPVHNNHSTVASNKPQTTQHETSAPNESDKVVPPTPIDASTINLDNSTPAAPTTTTSTTTSTATATTVTAVASSTGAGVKHENESSTTNSRITVSADNQSCPSGDETFPSAPPSSNSPLRDETKSFTWNGNENINSSYSHKQNHDIKSRKSSVSIPIVEPQIKKATTKGTNCPDNSSTIESTGNCNKQHPTNAATTNSNDLTASQPDIKDNSLSSSIVKVIYPFMTVPEIDFKKTISSFDEPVRCILEDFSEESCNESKCNLMDKLISTIFDNSYEPSSDATFIKELAHCLAYLVADDFSARIFPTSAPDNDALEDSIGSPFFVLLRSTFVNSKPSWQAKALSLLGAISKFLDATGFLILYFLRVTAIISGIGVAVNYVDFCNAAAKKIPKCLYDDLCLASTYDAEMFGFLLPSVFGDLASSGSFPITAKVINKEEPINLIEQSLNWESWEQYCLWKLINAQSVPIENYISILPKLDQKNHAEAFTCVILNLQKVTEPTTNMVQQIINCDCKAPNPFITSILRYWSMKTDAAELAKLISSLFDTDAQSPQVKRKGNSKTAVKSTPTLTPQNEKILQHLDSIRLKAPKNKLLAQPELLEMISQMEEYCNDNQKKRFSDLFANRPSHQTKKKQKRMGKTAAT